jgi:hypothetical protein
MSTTERKPYRKPAAPKVVGSVDASANSYAYFGGSDLGSYSSVPV